MADAKVETAAEAMAKLEDENRRLRHRVDYEKNRVKTALAKVAEKQDRVNMLKRQLKHSQRTIQILRDEAMGIVPEEDAGLNVTIGSDDGDDVDDAAEEDEVAVIFEPIVPLPEGVEWVIHGNGFVLYDPNDVLP